MEFKIASFWSSTVQFVVVLHMYGDLAKATLVSDQSILVTDPAFIPPRVNGVAIWVRMTLSAK